MQRLGLNLFMNSICFIFIGSCLYLQVVYGNADCPFPATNETLKNYCDWSSWLPWNCTCCGSDVADEYLGERMRGICCNDSQPIPECLAGCGVTLADGKQIATCRAACPLYVGQSIKCPLPNMTYGHHTIWSPSTMNDNKTSMSGAVIAGTVVGAVLAACIPACIIASWFWWTKRNKVNQDDPPNTDTDKQGQGENDK